MKKKCNQCDHYVELGTGKNGKGEDTIVGNCFRYPPRITDKGSAYPIVGSTERQCGEFKPKESRK